MNRLKLSLWILVGAALGCVAGWWILEFLVALRDGIRSGW